MILVVLRKGELVMKRRSAVMFFLAVGICLGGVLLQNTAEAASKIKIDKNHFPDKIFREYVKGFDGNKDGYLSKGERDAVKKVKLDNSLYPAEINFKGLEYFPKIEELTLIWCDLKNLRFNKLKNLKVVNLEFCKKVDKKESDKEYNFTANKKLKELQIKRGQVKRVLVAKDNKIKKFYFKVPKKMKQVDLSRFSKVEELGLFDSEVKSFNLEKCTSLKEVSITGNSKLTKLDFSNSPNLEELSVSGSHLISLKISKNTKLRVLNVAGNYLPKLNVSQNRYLEEFDCSSNKIKTLNVNKMQRLYNLNCAGLQLKKLDLTGNPNLEHLNCAANQLETLDLSANIKLEYLFCNLNPLEEIDISMLSELNWLDCRYNRLTSLDVTKNEKLRSIDFEGNRIPFIDFSKQMDLRVSEADKAVMLQMQLLPTTDGPAESGIPIDKKHFPDYAMRYAVLADFDTNHDGILSEKESNQKKSLGFWKYIPVQCKMIDCTGMKYLKGIEKVICSKSVTLLNNTLK